MRALADPLRTAASHPPRRIIPQFTQSITQIGIPPNARGRAVSDVGVPRSRKEKMTEECPGA